MDQMIPSSHQLVLMMIQGHRTPQVLLMILLITLPLSNPTMGGSRSRWGLNAHRPRDHQGIPRSTEPNSKSSLFDDPDLDLDTTEEELDDHNSPRQGESRLRKLHREMVALGGLDSKRRDDKSTGCPREFKGKCSCGYFDEKFTVNCTGSGFHSAKPLKALPFETEELIFTGNNLGTLPRNAFGDLDFPSLKLIDLTGNHITWIEAGAFQYVSTVEKLILNHNDLSNDSLHEHPKIFANLTNLKELHLTNTFNEEIWSLSDLAQIFIKSNLTQLTKLHIEQNEIEFIDDRSLFCQLPALRQLYIAQNKLTDIDLQVDCFQDLEVLDLRRNRIRTINNSTRLWGLLEAKNGRGEWIRLELLENPLDCDCNLQPFIDWLRNESYKVPDLVRDNEYLRCETGLPVSNARKLVRLIEATECRILGVTGDAEAITHGILWILILLGLLGAGCILWVNRGRLTRGVPPLHLLQPTVHGVKYTSIERSEVAEVAHV